MAKGRSSDSITRRTPLYEYRRRMRQHGIVRVEVKVHKEDAALIRDIARVLDDPRQANEARTLLRAHFAVAGAKGLKALLREAPLEGIELTRSRDLGREVEL